MFDLSPFEIVVRQCILYSLPMLMTITLLTWMQRHLLPQSNAPQFVNYQVGTFLPFVVSLLMARAMIVLLIYPVVSGLYAAWIRVLGHVLLCFLGWVLYTWALSHPPLTGLPALHHWWAKVLMYLNLCLIILHLLPLPHMLLGELLLLLKPLQPYAVWLRAQHWLLIAPITLLVLTPWLDLGLGMPIVFPIYEQLASWAT